MTEGRATATLASSSSSLEAFLEALASKAPTPGGGAAAALCGSLAAGLVAMVARLTLGKCESSDGDPEAEAVEAEMRGIVREAEGLRAELAALVDEDSRSFEAVMAAYRLPRRDEAQRRARKRRIQTALKEATLVPYRTAVAAQRALELACRLIEHGRRQAVSDAGAAAHLAEAAAQAALLNVEVNLRAIEDASFVEAYRRKRRALVEASSRAYRQALARVEARLP